MVLIEYRRLGEKISRHALGGYPHRQFLNRLEDGLTELICLSPVYPPVKGFADASAGQPQFDIVRFGDHRVLYTLANNRPTPTGRKHTLIVVRRTPVDVNAALACVMPVAPSAWFKASMATFSEERTLSRPFGS